MRSTNFIIITTITIIIRGISNSAGLTRRELYASRKAQLQRGTVELSVY